MSCINRVSRLCGDWSLNPLFMWVICIHTSSHVDVSHRIQWRWVDVCVARRVVCGMVKTCYGMSIIQSRKFCEDWQRFRLTFSMINSFLLSSLSFWCNVIIGRVSNSSSWFKRIPNQKYKVFIHQLLCTLLVQLSSVVPCFSSCKEWHRAGRRRTQVLVYKSMCRNFFMKIYFT